MSQFEIEIYLTPKDPTHPGHNKYTLEIIIDMSDPKTLTNPNFIYNDSLKEQLTKFMQDADVESINRVGQMTVAWNDFKLRSDLIPEEVNDSVMKLTLGS